MTTIDKIRAEIMRMHQEAVGLAIGNQTDWLKSRVATCVDLLSFLDTLDESEDERIRKEIVECIETLVKQPGASPRLCDWLTWLEKQKEKLKSADSIPADCVSNAKCEDRWHKTANSLPDSGRDVLAKDALGNYFLASFDGAQWFVSVYDGQDHPVLHTPPILEWCDIPSETSKESLHIPESCKENADSLIDEDEKIRKALIYDIERLPIQGVLIHRPTSEYIAYLEKQKINTEGDFGRGYDCGYQAGYAVAMNEMKPKVATATLDSEKQKEQKPVEWSEEDEAMKNNILRILQCFEGSAVCESNPSLSTTYPLYQREMDWLKSLRPQKKEDLPKWKIAKKDEDTDTLDYVILFKHDGGDSFDWWSVEVTNRLRQGDLYFKLADLKKLPKEDEK